MKESTNNTVSLNFKALFQVIWKEKILIFMIILASAGIGLWYGFSQKEQFTAQGKILPEMLGRGGLRLGNLAGIASLAGVDIGSADGTEAVRPDLYPDILKSTPFFLELFKQPVVTRDNRKITFEQFYEGEFEKKSDEKQKDTVKAPHNQNGVLVIGKKYERRIQALKARIVGVIDKKSGVINISVKMPDPYVAAEVANFAMNYLTQYVTRYRVDKAQKDLDFLEERVNVAKGKYYFNQTKKAQYSDQFQESTMRLQSADIQRERIESEYRMASTFYNELLKKYEEAKIKVQQETPVFKVLEPPTVPTRKSEPRKSLILLVAVFIGGLIALIAALIRNNNYSKVINS
ncbi:MULTISPECIES: Wzz/FepE/Etk N-terminal domain-containing protein [Emticicia]|uniref:Wzz/FepE/Etk N-terminal domain-containing protein n=1 Tax=Emticicia TaxID=312278 RepID=UPI00209D7D4F|nr:MULTISPECIES: Wzz/FepE/Etk N-terminal domain-containing protein [Emticicia]UTA68412.1 Wzz/FepE/Etk N-terminal domain-containing protein [Emticicia sp. 21SJ11W-3]